MRVRSCITPGVCRSSQAFRRTRSCVSRRSAPDPLGDLGQLLQSANVTRAAQLLKSLRKPPATRFAGKVSPHRVVDVVALPLSGFKAIRASMPHATINDIFMTTVGGALRQYLDAKGELPDATLTCMLPMSFRDANKGADAGNQIGMAVVPLHTEMPDPVDRLHAIRRGAGKAKAMAMALGRDLSARLFEVLPTAASELITTRLVLPRMSIVVSNVRGPDVPLFMAGARLVNYAPVSIAFDGIGLNVTGFSYNGMLWICAVACRDRMPDPDFFAECLRENFAALEAAARTAATHNDTSEPVRTKGSGPQKKRRSGRAPGKRQVRRRAAAS